MQIFVREDGAHKIEEKGTAARPKPIAHIEEYVRNHALRQAPHSALKGVQPNSISPGRMVSVCGMVAVFGKKVFYLLPQQSSIPLQNARVPVLEDPTVVNALRSEVERLQQTLAQHGGARDIPGRWGAAAEGGCAASV